MAASGRSSTAGTASVTAASNPEARAASSPAARAALDAAGVALADVKAIKTHNPFAVNDIYLARELGIEAADPVLPSPSITDTDADALEESA